MKIYTISSFLFILSFFTFIQAQTEFINFNGAFSRGDTARMKSILSEWSINTSENNNPELVICQFNYHLFIAEKTVTKEVKNTSSEHDVEFVFVAPDGKSSVTFEQTTFYDPIQVEHAEQTLKNGIKKFPNRLDMRFGLITLFQKTKSWVKYSEAVVECLNQSLINENSWLWSQNKIFEGGETSFLNGLDKFQSDLFASGEDALLPYMRLIAEETLNRYPNHLQSFFDIAITYVLSDQYTDAISILMTAEKKHPKDQILLGNLAYSHKMNGNKEMAMYYYKKVEQFGDREHSLAAKAFMTQLQK